MPFVSDDKCCTACVAPHEKYYSIDKVHNMCGECCMDPKDFWKYKIFEPGLTNATDNNPCAEAKFTDYQSTVTHGFGPVKMTLDLYKPTTILGAPPSGTYCGKVPFIISMNMTIHADSMTFDYNNDVKVTGFKVSCSGEPYKFDEATNTFDISGALSNPSDCLAKAIAKDAKAKPSITFDGTNIAAKNGYGTLKLKPTSGSCP